MIKSGVGLLGGEGGLLRGYLLGGGFSSRIQSDTYADLGGNLIEASRVDPQVLEVVDRAAKNNELAHRGVGRRIHITTPRTTTNAPTRRADASCHHTGLATDHEIAIVQPANDSAPTPHSTAGTHHRPADGGCLRWPAWTSIIVVATHHLRPRRLRPDHLCVCTRLATKVSLPVWPGLPFVTHQGYRDDVVGHAQQASASWSGLRSSHLHRIPRSQRCGYAMHFSNYQGGEMPCGKKESDAWYPVWATTLEHVIYKGRSARTPALAFGF